MMIMRLTAMNNKNALSMPSLDSQDNWCIMKKDGNKICILLVEDDRAIRETMWMVLESEPNFEVHAAEDGKMALRMIADAKVLPDLVITDLMMPNVSGWELVDTLRKLERTHSLPIIVYSGVSHYNEDNKILHNCFFMRKPVELDHLFATIGKALSTPIMGRDTINQNGMNHATDTREVKNNETKA